MKAEIEVVSKCLVFLKTGGPPESSQGITAAGSDVDKWQFFPLFVFSFVRIPVC